MRCPRDTTQLEFVMQGLWFCKSCGHCFGESEVLHEPAELREEEPSLISSATLVGLCQQSDNSLTKPLQSVSES